MGGLAEIETRLDSENFDFKKYFAACAVLGNVLRDSSRVELYFRLGSHCLEHMMHSNVRAPCFQSALRADGGAFTNLKNDFCNVERSNST